MTASRRRGSAECDTVLSVVQGPDGIWSVNEQGVNKAAITYFSSRWAALRHAVRAARDKASCRVRVLEPGGAEACSRVYADATPRPGEPTQHRPG